MNLPNHLIPLASRLELDNSQKQLVSTRPSRHPTYWRCFSRYRDVWSLVEALDNRGERERELKKRILKRVSLDVEPAESEGYLTEGHVFLGRRVLRKFNKRMVIGIITGWLPAEGEDIALWRVSHTDGDEEDLEEHEVEKWLVPLPKEGEEEEPGVVSYYYNEFKGVTPVTNAQIGLSALKSQFLSVMNNVVGGLKGRGSAWNREGRREWEHTVRETVSPEDLVRLLLELESVLHEVQTEEDVQDEAEAEREREKARETMLAEGWLFEHQKEEEMEVEKERGGEGEGEGEMDEKEKDMKEKEKGVKAEKTTVPPVTQGSTHIGQRVRRFFKRQAADGCITAYLPPSRNEGLPLWHMQHDDGDEEDLDQEELLSSLRAFSEDQEEPEGEGEGDAVTEEEGETEEEEEEEEEEESEGSEDGDDDTGSSKTLWPTAGTRARWQTAVRGAHTVGELSLAVSNLSEHARAFGLSDPLIVAPSTSSARSRHRSVHTAAMWTRKDGVGPGSPQGKNGGRRLSQKALAEKKEKRSHQSLAHTRHKSPKKKASRRVDVEEREREREVEVKSGRRGSERQASQREREREKERERESSRMTRTRGVKRKVSYEEEEEEEEEERERERGGDSRSMRPRKKVCYAE
eukprot:CAMPEP_0182416520 /NCGR_PEP_ID=MMETSP1167-20130531/823_1 /TAXON_ID=2988 /ORGANISM="Mallomonas Sp, Strain CCMP3275" /LENGTH=632 /DNA_ID=CAMNT_0024589349 /DNA_START=132 /DNA_END=2030 /DNA_ORIENTATION=-